MIATVTSRDLDDYPLQSYDKLRYPDADPMGHVNNSAFATFLETGRVEMLHRPEGPLAIEGAGWVIARLALDFVSEVRWPGSVDIGTGVTRIGSSSVSLEQALFQDGRLAALAETVIVQFDQATRRPTPLSEGTVAKLRGWSLTPEDANA